MDKLLFLQQIKYPLNKIMSEVNFASKKCCVVIHKPVTNKPMVFVYT